MPSKMVNDRQKSCRAVEASVNTHGARVSEALGGLFTPYLQEGETAPDILAFLNLASRHLEDLRTRLAAADQRHLDETAKDAEPLRVRNEVAERLRGKMRGLRDSLTGIYGAERLLELAGVETPDQDPVSLEAQIKRVMDRLSEPGLQLKDPRFPGIQIDLQSIYQQLLPDYEELTAALAIRALTARRAETTLIAKQRALAAYEDGFSWLAAVLEALYKLAGEKELAKRVRTSKHRRSRTDEDADDSGDAAAADPATADPATADPAANDDLPTPSPAQEPVAG